jgi:cytochrome P450
VALTEIATSRIPAVAGGTLSTRYAYESDRVGCLSRWAGQYGDVFRFGTRTVVVNSPDLVHQVLVETNKSFAAATPLVEDLHTSSSENLELWMRGRRQGRRGIHPDRVRDCSSRLNEALRRGLAELAGHSSDLTSAAERVCGHAVVDICLGADAPDFYALVARASRDILAYNQTLHPPLWGAARRRRRAVAAEVDVSARLMSLIAARRTAGVRPDDDRDMISILLRQDNPLPDTSVAAMARITLIGGHSTPGTALAWIIRELAARPKIADRVRGEALASRTGNGDLRAEELPYTTALVKEMIRLYPPTWMLARVARQPLDLGPWRLAEGLRVVFCPYLLHRDERWWEQPQDLLPERWLGDEVPHAPNAYIPFGTGPRMCMGDRLGLTMLAVATAQMVADYRISVEEPAGAQPNADILLAPSQARVLLTPRHDHGPAAPDAGSR